MEDRQCDCCGDKTQEYSCRIMNLKRWGEVDREGKTYVLCETCWKSLELCLKLRWRNCLMP